ncbi:MAG: efflux RND transporter periplasmic adaptor subunit [Telluria sp.]
MKKQNLVLIVGVAAIIGAAMLYLNQGAGASAASGKTGASAGRGGAQPFIVVNVVAPQRRDVPVVLQANGTVTPISTVDLHPQITSTVSRVHIKEGQFVKAGELMFSLDERSGRASVDKTLAQLARSRAALGDVERQVRRGEELFAQKFIAPSALETLRSQLEAARAVLAADQAALQSTRVEASHSAIRSPMSGRVGAINVFPGSLVQLNTSLTTITQLDPINVAFTLPESSLSDLLAAQKDGPVPVAASLGGAGKELAGALSFIDNAVDPAAGTIRVKARFDNRSTQLWPGQYVSTRVTVRTLKGALVVPQAAIVDNARGTFVYVVGPDQSALQVPVVRLYSFGPNAAVSGLAGDEKVITEGKQNLRPGAKVRLAEAAGERKRKRAAKLDDPS